MIRLHPDELLRGRAARYHKVKFVLSLTNSPHGRIHGFAPTTNPGEVTQKQSLEELFSIKKIIL